MRWLLLAARDLAARGAGGLALPAAAGVVVVAGFSGLWAVSGGGSACGPAAAWLGVLVAATLGAGCAFDPERGAGIWAFRATPASPAALFAVKSACVFVTAGTGAAAALLAAAFFVDARAALAAAPLAALALAGLAFAGTAVGAAGEGSLTRAEGWLALLPLFLPHVFLGASGTIRLLAGQCPGGEVAALAGAALVGWAMGSAVFGKVVWG